MHAHPSSTKLLCIGVFVHVDALCVGGPTGLLCVERILNATDLSVRAVVRSKARSESAIKAAAGKHHQSTTAGMCTPQPDSNCTRLCQGGRGARCTLGLACAPLLEEGVAGIMHPSK